MEEQKAFVDKNTDGSITEAEAREMVHAYTIENPGNTKCVWFSLAQIDKIHTYLKEEEKAGMGTDGLRVYFGQYTKNILELPAENDLIGRNTVIFVSTKLDPDGFHEDYFNRLDNSDSAQNRGELCLPNCGGTKL